MTEDPGRTSGLAGSGGAMSERMQALLSRAAEEQLTEQRQVSTVLGELRGLVNGVSEQLRGTASSARLDSLGGDLTSLVTELRSVNDSLGERLDQLTTSVDALSSFPGALASLQREVSGLHDRLAPLAEVRSGLADLTARTGGVEALRPEIEAVAHKLEGVATSEELARSGDSLATTLGERLDRLESIAARPVLTTDDLSAAVDPVLTRVDGLSEPILERVGAVDGRLEAVQSRLGAVSDAAGGVPAVAQDLARVASQVEELGSLRGDVAAVHAGVTSLQDDSPLPALALAVAAVHADLGDLGGRVAEVTVPSADDVATAVTQQVTDRLVDQLAPRVADLVLERVAETLVAQVSGSVAASVQEGLAERVRAVGADSERRINAHVDEAVLALAEALLRRRRAGARPGGGAGLVHEDGSAEVPAAVRQDETGWPEVATAASAGPVGPGASAELSDAPTNDGSQSADAVDVSDGERVDEPPAAEDVVTTDEADAADTTDDADSLAPDPTDDDDGSDEGSASPAPSPFMGVDTDAAPRSDNWSTVVTTSAAPRPFGRTAPEAATDTADPDPHPTATALTTQAYSAFTVPRATPPPVEAPAEGAYDEEDEDGQRRRPWWRPGG